jgi:hypothetical protein
VYRRLAAARLATAHRFLFLPQYRRKLRLHVGARELTSELLFGFLNSSVLSSGVTQAMHRSPPGASQRFAQ